MSDYSYEAFGLGDYGDGELEGFSVIGESDLDGSFDPLDLDHQAQRDALADLSAVRVIKTATRATVYLPSAARWGSGPFRVKGDDGRFHDVTVNYGGRSFYRDKTGKVRAFKLKHAVRECRADNAA